MTCYVVYVGWVPAFYDHWEHAHIQVHGFSGNRYKGYTTRAEAEARYTLFLAEERRRNRRIKTATVLMLMIIVPSFLLYLYLSS